MTLANPKEKTSNDKERHYGNHSDYVEQVREWEIVIVCSHEKLQSHAVLPDSLEKREPDFYFIFTLHMWREKLSRTFAG
ncbi:MAG: hypothetical protein ABI142_04570 [Bryocella sp.]